MVKPINFHEFTKTTQDYKDKKHIKEESEWLLEFMETIRKEK
jgi:hypothetical protein